MRIAQLCLEVIEIAQGAVFGLAVNFFTRHGQIVQIDVVAALGPVEHDVAAGQTPVGKHHLRAPGVAAVPVMRRVVILRFRQQGGVAVFLDHSHIGHVLEGRAVFEFLCADRQGYVPQLRAVDEDLRPDTAAVGEREAPVPVQGRERRAEAHLHTGLIGHVGEDIGPHGGVEEDVGDPAALQGFVTAVPGGQGIREFSEKATAQAIVAVDGAHTGRCEHATQPGTLLHHQHLGAVTGRLDSRRRATRAAAHDHDVVGTGTGCQTKQQERRGGKSLNHWYLSI